MSKFPLCKAAGLNIKSDVIYRGECHHNPDIFDAIYASSVEALLVSATVVYGGESIIWTQRQSCLTQDTHSARLLLIQPIVKDTTESLLRELIHARTHGIKPEDIIIRARKLLGMR